MAVLRDLGDDGGGAGAGASAHAGRDEDHVGPFNDLTDAVFGGQGGLLADFGVASCAEAFGDFLTDDDAVGGFGGG